MSVATQSLADEIAAYLEREGPSSCEGLARGMHRLRTTLLHVLDDDPRFVRTGRGRATRWHLVANVNGNGVERLANGVPSTSAQNGSDPTADAAEAFPATCSDPELHHSWGAHYTGSSGRHCVRCEPPGIPPLTEEEYEDGLGGAERRQRYEAAREEERRQRFVEAYRRASPQQQLAIVSRFRAQIRADELVLEGVI